MSFTKFTKLHQKTITLMLFFNFKNIRSIINYLCFVYMRLNKHIIFCNVLTFRVGEGRAYWSLGNAYTALNRHDIALGYAEKHLIVSKEVSLFGSMLLLRPCSQ